jgi:hypothetical protein
VDWKEIHAEAWRRMRQTGFLEWKRVSTSIVVPFMIGLVQWRAGLSFPINIAITFSSGLLLYGLLILVERWVRIREVIAERLDTNASAIQKLDQRIAELETPQFTLDVDRVAIAPEMPTTPLHIVIRLDVTVRTGTKPVTLHNWNLRSPSAPNLKSQIRYVHSTIGLAGYSVRVETEGVAQINVAFFVYGKPKEDIQQMKWQLEFEDSSQAHKKEISSELYI